MIDYIKGLLGNVSQLDNVISASELGQKWTDTAAIMAAQFGALVGGRIYPLVLENEKSYPNIVYSLASSAPTLFDGYPFYRSDVYVLSVRAQTLPELTALVRSISDTVEAYQVADAAGTMEINDTAHEVTGDPYIYAAHFEILVTHLSIENQALPLAAVSIQQVIAGQNDLDVIVSQNTLTYFAIDILANSDDIEAIRPAIKAEILGKQETPLHDKMLYVSGTKVDHIGHLTLWRETYQAGIHIRS